LPLLLEAEASDVPGDARSLELGPEAALDFELDALHAPTSDADLDAWLHATSELLHDG
jgi:hypothetical protein